MNQVRISTALTPPLNPSFSVTLPFANVPTRGTFPNGNVGWGTKEGAQGQPCHRKGWRGRGRRVNRHDLANWRSYFFTKMRLLGNEKPTNWHSGQEAVHVFMLKTSVFARKRLFFCPPQKMLHSAVRMPICQIIPVSGVYLEGGRSVTVGASAAWKSYHGNVALWKRSRKSPKGRLSGLFSDSSALSGASQGGWRPWETPSGLFWGSGPEGSARAGATLAASRLDRKGAAKGCNFRRLFTTCDV